MKAFFMVERLGEAFTVQSQKAKDGVLYKRIVQLVEAGVKRGDSVVATILSEDAQHLNFEEGDFIYASIRLATHEYNGQIYMDAIMDNYLTIAKNQN